MMDKKIDLAKELTNKSIEAFLSKLVSGNP